MPSYLVESYRAGPPSRLAGARRTTFLPGDETCFHRFKAPSSDALGDATRPVALGYSRIVEAVELQ